MNCHYATASRLLPAVRFTAILALGLGLCRLPAPANPGGWTTKADLPVPRVGAAAAIVDGILYVAGGHTNIPDGPPLRTLYAYDPRSDTWSAKASMSDARILGAASAVDGVLYVFGGVDDVASFSVLNTVEAYDPKTDTWTKKASMPSARGDIAACTMDGLVYVVGGWYSGSLLSTVECYDPKADRWTRKASLPVTAEVPSVQAVNGRLYAFVGTRTFAYDPGTDRWTERANLPTEDPKAVGSASGVVDGKIYLFGGILRPSQCGSDAGVVYDPVLDRFTALPDMPVPNMVAAHATIGGKVYVAGGASGAGSDCSSNVVYSSLWVYEPPGGTPMPGQWVRKTDLPVPRVAAAAAEVNGILYVAGGHTNAPYGPGSRTLFAYDPGSDTWSTKASMSNVRVLGAASAVDGVLYVFGGIADVQAGSVLNSVEAYDPKTDTWTKKASMPTARADIAACTLDGLVYVVGGWVPGSFLSTVERYDPKADRWTSLASLPVTAEVPSVQAVNGRVYAFVGSRTFAYDPGTDRWTERAPLPASELNAVLTASGVVEGKIYLLGGLLRPSECASDAALVYDPVQDRFTALPSMPVPNMGAAVTIGGKIYLAGGASGAGSDCPSGVVYSSLWVYEPGSSLPPRILSIDLRNGNTTVRLVWQGEAGRSYDVETRSELVGPAWLPFTLSAGSTLVATNPVVEATGTVSPADSRRFFRVKVVK